DLGNLFCCCVPCLIRIHCNNALLELIEESVLLLNLLVCPALTNGRTYNCNWVKVFILLCIRKNLESCQTIVLTTHSHDCVIICLEPKLTKQLTIFTRLPNRTREVFRMLANFVS